MSLFAELKRRNIFRIGLAYIVIGWLIAQVAEFAFEAFGAPDWVLKTLIVVLLLGLPLALFFVWAFEVTPEGVKREAEVDRSKSITLATGRQLDFVVIGALVIALGYQDKSFLRFLVSGEKDVDLYRERKRRSTSRERVRSEET